MLASESRSGWHLVLTEGYAEDIVESFKLSGDEKKSYETVRGKFESYLVKKINILFDQISFFQRRQEEGESVASLVNDVNALAKHCILAKHCNFGALHDEMVRDTCLLVAGIHNKRLLEQLQLDADLTLEKAVVSIWQLETVHKEQVFLHGDDTRQFPIDLVKTSKRPGRNMSNTGRRSGQS